MFTSLKNVCDGAGKIVNFIKSPVKLYCHYYTWTEITDSSGHHAY